MRKLGMGALLGVSAGSAEPAKFIILEHGKIAGIGTVDAGDATVVDASGQIILPGFVQTHIHLCQTLMRNCATQSDFYFNAADGADLSSVFSTIGDALSNLRVSR